MDTTREKSESRTVVTKRHSYGGAQTYVQPKVIQINRRVHTAGGVGLGSMNQSMSSYSNRGSLGMAANAASGIASKECGTMKIKREGEKKDMQNLNDRLSKYIMDVRALQVENNDLREKLKKKRKEFDVEPLKEAYQGEINEAKNLLEVANKENAELKINMTTYEDEIEDMRGTDRINVERIEELQDKVNKLIDENVQRVADYNLLQGKVGELEKQVTHWRAKYNEVYTQLQATRADLRDETSQRVNESQRAAALQEELEFLRSITTAEINEYKAMLAKDNDSGTNVRAQWGNEMTKCLQELRSEYEDRLSDISEEMSARYESQLTEIRQNVKPEQAAAVHTKSEKTTGMMSVQKDMRIKELEGQLERMKLEIVNVTRQLQETQQELDTERDLKTTEMNKLRAELETVLLELQMLMDAKLSLELEIAAYRKLLEGEEHRLSTGFLTQQIGGFRDESGDALANILEFGSGGGGSGGGGGGGGGGGSISMGGSSSMSGDSASTSTATGRITMQRSSKGVISIAEVEGSGQYVTLENTSSSRSKQSVNLKGWTLDRTVPATGLSQKISIEFFFKNETIIAGEQSIKIWGKKYQAMARGADLVADFDDWDSVNRNSTFTLADENNASKATLTIKVVY